MLVELHAVQREPEELRQAGCSGAEIVQHQPGAAAPQGCQLIERAAADAVEQNLLGDLDLDGAERKPGALDLLHDVERDIRPAYLRRRKVQRNARIARIFGWEGSERRQRLFAHRGAKPGRPLRTDHREQGFGRDRADRRMAPARQRLDGDEPWRGGRHMPQCHDRLQMNHRAAERIVDGCVRIEGANDGGGPS